MAPPSAIREVTLRPTRPDDLDALYAMQADPEANALAGTKPRPRDAYMALWDTIFKDPNVIPRVILVDGVVAGGVSVFQVEHQDMLGYWIDRAWWGRGVATRAVALFLREVSRRPLVAHVAVHNAASIRILERLGFRRTGTFMGEDTTRYVAGEVAAYVLD